MLKIIPLIFVHFHVIQASSLCGSRSGVFCLDSKKYYTCSDADKVILEKELGNDTIKQAIYLFGKMETGYDDCNMQMCKTGFCDDIETVCNTELPYEETLPCNQCNENYACTSLNTYKYCENFTIKGDAFIQCPENYFCHFNNQPEIKSPCEKAEVVQCHPLLHCYTELNEDARVTADYTDFCVENGDGMYYLANSTDCQS